MKNHTLIVFWFLVAMCVTGCNSKLFIPTTPRPIGTLLDDMQQYVNSGDIPQSLCSDDLGEINTMLLNHKLFDSKTDVDVISWSRDNKTIKTEFEILIKDSSARSPTTRLQSVFVLFEKRSTTSSCWNLIRYRSGIS